MSETKEVVVKMVFSAMKTYLDYKKRKVFDLEFHPVAGDTEENKKFWEATPSGIFNFQTVNEKAAKMFQFEHEYYVTFREATPILEIVKETGEGLQKV
mgnify:CR=1 FL=1